MDLLIVVAVVTLLTLGTGLYVAAEFSTVSASRARLAQLANGGNRLAARILGIVESPHKLDTYIAACQIGITVTSLTVGYYGRSRLLALLEPQLQHLDPSAQLLASSVSAAVILLFLTVVQVILGELVPKNIGVQYPERLSVLTAPPMRWSVIAFGPLIWLFNGSGRLILRLIGSSVIAEHAHVHSPEEIVMIVEESTAGGVFDAEERRLLVNTLQLRNLTARKVMIPRNYMLAASVDESCEELFQLLANSPYSRLPLYEQTIDSIVGVLHLKDLLQAYYHGVLSTEASMKTCRPREMMHPMIHVPETAEVAEIMDQMQREHHNLAIVVDEYGGTAGMITFEDLVEEIIGEFQDEFDTENPPLELRPNQRVRVRGDVLLDDLNEFLDLTLSAEDVDTIGGLVLQRLGRIPDAGETVEFEDITIRVDANISQWYRIR